MLEDVSGGLMSAKSWRRLQIAARCASEAKRGAMQAFTTSDSPVSKTRKRPWQKPRSGGKRSRQAAKAKAKAMTEALEAAKGEAVIVDAAASVALQTAKDRVIEMESLQRTTQRELKKVSTTLKRVQKAAASLDPWVRRPSTQPARFVHEPRVLMLLHGVFDNDLCDATAAELLARKPWVNQGGDTDNAGGFSSTRYQLHLPKAKSLGKINAILGKFSEALHFTPCSHNHLRSPCSMKGGSTQRWHLDNGHGRSLSLIVALTNRAFEYAAVGVGTTQLELKKGDCLLFTSWVWHRGVANPADSVALFAYFDDEHFDVPPPSDPRYSAAQDDNRAGFKVMLDDDQWDELNVMHDGDPEPVQTIQLDVREDAHAIDKLATILGKAFKYKEDYTSMEL